MTNEKLKQYIWEWETGGYNHCRAESLQDAKDKAKLLAKNTSLIPIIVRLAKPGEVEKYRNFYTD